MSAEPDLERAQDRNDPSLEQALRRHLARLQSFVRFRIGGLRKRESVSDLVQSTFRELFEDGDLTNPLQETHFQKRLFTLAERKILDRARYWNAQKRTAAREVPLAGGEEPLEGNRISLTPSQQATVDEEISKIEEAFDALNQEQREAIILSRLMGLSHAEIAVRTNRTQLASRKLLSRSLAKLSELLRRGRAR